MIKVESKIKNGIIQLHGNGLFSKEEVTVSISKKKDIKGISFVLNNEIIPVDIKNVSNTTRNTMLSNGKESICLVEHFLAACSLLGVDGIKISTNKNELVFGDGSASHWEKAFLDNGFCDQIFGKYSLRQPIFLKNDKKQIVAFPHADFKVSYFLDWDHPALGKMWASWKRGDKASKILNARTFATKEENDFFGMSDLLLTLDKNGFNKKLHDPLEPAYHKVLDIIGDLRLCGVNPLEINMHVIGFKSGHALNVELAKQLPSVLLPL